jgi:hypothetical protein
MRVRLSSSILSCILVLVGLTPPLMHAAPTAQWPTSGSYDSPEATMLRTIREVVPPEVLQQTPVQLLPLDADTYLVSHPGLVWPEDQAPNAQAVVAQYFAPQGPGWRTALVNGPQGRGVYLTYDPAVSGTPQAGLLPTLQQLLPREVLQQTPLQLQQLDADTYLLNHPGLFWQVDQAPSAQAAALQLAGRIPNLHTMVLNGPQGFGIYLTYDTVVTSAAQPGLLSTVQQILPPEVLRQTPLQFQSLDGSSTYLVSHPSLFWPADQAAIAQAVVQQLASQTPGWSTTTTNGPQGFGIYATYQPAPSASSQAGLLLAIQQTLPPSVLQQTPVQLQYLDSSTYVVSHPSLFWPVDQAPAAQAMVQQLSSRSRGWGVTVANGVQGYGLYLTYRLVA